MATQKLSTYQVHLTGKGAWDSIINTILSYNTDKSYCSINEQGDDYIGGCFIFESLQNQTIYNISENKFEKITVFKQYVLKFDIFLNNNMMFLWGNKKVASLFITTLEQASNNSLIIDYNKTDFKTMIKRLITNHTVSFSKMKIVDIVIGDGIVANCNVNLSNYDNPSALVTKYMDSIAQITVSFGVETTAVSVSIYSSGSVVVFKEREDIDDEVINAINLMIGGVM